MAVRIFRGRRLEIPEIIPWRAMIAASFQITSSWTSVEKEILRNGE